MKMPTRFWVGISGGKLGGERGNRTHDTRIFSPLLYHLSYLAILFSNNFRTRTYNGTSLGLPAATKPSRDGPVTVLPF
jgi:hypothetical protein